MTDPGAARIPRLHVVTDDVVVAEPRFVARAAALLEAHGRSLALHLRGHGTSAATLYRLAVELDGPARAVGARLVVNDRVDVALAGGWGAQLGLRSIPVGAARALLGPGAILGYSAHAGDEARIAVAAGADFLLFGTVWPSATHPDGGAAGPGRLAAVVAEAGGPVIAIGGVTPARAGEALAAGAHGVAVLSGIWTAEEPARAAGAYLEVLGVTG